MNHAEAFFFFFFFFSKNNLLTFYSIYILECLTLFVKNKHLFHTRNTNIYNLRNPGSLTIPRHNTTFFEKQTHYSSVILFNALPNQFKTEPDIVKFRKKVKLFLINKEYYSVREYLDDK